MEPQSQNARQLTKQSVTSTKEGLYLNILKELGVKEHLWPEIICEIQEENMTFKLGSERQTSVMKQKEAIFVEKKVSMKCWKLDIKKSILIATNRLA